MSDTINTASGVAALVKERISRIKQEDGFATDIGNTVFEGKVLVADEDVPVGGCVSIIEGVDTVNDRPGKIPNALIEVRFGMVCYLHCDPNNPSTACHAAIRDVKKVIFANRNATFDEKVFLVKYLGKDIGPRADGAKIVMALVEISVQYVEDLSNP